MEEKSTATLEKIQQAAMDDSKLQEARQAIEEAAAAMGQIGDQLTAWADRLEQQSPGHLAARIARDIADRCYALQSRLAALPELTTDIAFRFLLFEKL